MKLKEVIFKYYIYRLVYEDGATETMQSDSDELPVMSHWILPAKEFHYMWENLYYDCDIKNNVSKFICIIQIKTFPIQFVKAILWVHFM